MNSPYTKNLIKNINEVAAFISKDLNPNIDTFLLTSGSEKNIWWSCTNNHEWQQRIVSFVKNPVCQYCSNNKVWKGFNDLATISPNLAKEWHPTKNLPLTPQDILYKSRKKVWWKDNLGHEWEATCGDRTRKDGKATGCPTCKGKKVLTGFNDLATISPNLAKEWHPTKNLPLTPQNITAASNKKVWWQCNKGHEWEATCYDRTRKDGKSTGCPVCKGKKVLTGFNDLATISPNLAKEWHPTKNGNLSPKLVTVSSGKKVWWQDSFGHEWETRIASRSNGDNCPFCSGKRVLKSFNDLTTINPIFAKEWHPTKNLPLTPQDITVGSNKKVWWQCNKGHEWEATCGDRNYGYGCLKCSNGYSKREEELQQYITSLGFDIKTNIRSVIQGELDIYVPEKNIAIEYNGLYWHSEEAGKDKNYHYNKWLACKEKRIQLIQIWEDDYKRNPELIKNMLAHKLGASTQPKIYARNTTIKTLSKTESDEFLNNNHIQGSVDGAIRLGLYTESKLVAVMVLKTEAGSQGKTLNLLRYATSVNVVGGFTKILSWVQKNNPQITSIVTFSDNTISDGGLYQNNGFHIAGTIKPDYMYIVNKNRNHKFNYRLKRFKNDPSLLWEDGLTETQLAKLNNLTRIWDAGKTKWIKNL